MGRKIHDETKKKRGYGTGTGRNYLPWITTEEFNSMGTCCNPIDWKTGRTVHLLSQTEKRLWYLLRWDDDIVDIREQYPLDIEITKEIARKFNINHPKYRGKEVVMTTDFLVTLKSGAEIAINVKSDEAQRNDQRTIEKTFIEKYYWKECRDTTFKLVSNKDINENLSMNIELVCVYYDINKVHDESSFLKYLIANKEIEIDMKSEILNFRELLKQYGGNLWKNTQLKSEQF